MNWHNIYVFLAWTSFVTTILFVGGSAALDKENPKRKIKKSEGITFYALFLTFVITGALAVGTS